MCVVLTNLQMELYANIRTFVLAVQTGSFSAAARKKNMTPSAIARQIAALEEGLGARLLVRTTRSMELTEAGKIYFERALTLVHDYDDMNHNVSNLEATPRGLLRVSASVSLGTTRLAAALPEFLAKFPDVNVQLLVSDRVVDLIDDNVDVALRIARELPDSNLIGRKLFRYQRVICASPQYLDATAPIKTPGDVAKHKCLAFHAGGEFTCDHPAGRSWNLRRRNKTVTVPISGPMEANSLTALVTAAINGLGLVSAPRWMVEEHLDAGTLRAVLTEYEVDPGSEETWVYAVFRSDRFLAARTRAFIDFVADRFAGMAPWEQIGRG